ncbi:MAG TPA: cbb3-type cytochrome c oxidase subunit 3 [Parasulfuritortus sp.]
MDSGLIGASVTVLFFLLFIAIVWWAYHKDNRKKYEDAANLPFEEGDEGTGRRDS